MMAFQLVKMSTLVKAVGNSQGVLSGVVGMAAVAMFAMPSPALAIQPQIPTLQTCNATKIEGRAKVHIESRSDATRPGTFGILLEVKCDPRAGFPRGKVELVKIGMTDAMVHGGIVATTIDQVTSTGKHATMAFVSGRCRVIPDGPIPAEPVDVPVTDLSGQSLDATVSDATPVPSPLPNPFSGCRYWITLADNFDRDNEFKTPGETADVVGVVVMNGRGKRIAHGMGPVVSGNISIAPSRN